MGLIIVKRTVFIVKRTVFIQILHQEVNKYPLPLRPSFVR